MPDRRPPIRLPSWLRVRQSIPALSAVRRTLRGHGVLTVCEEARCPNKTHCFSRPTAAFMILGGICTRGCGFCSVEPSAPGHAPAPPDPEEPVRVALAAREMGLAHVVITSVTRDDLPDGGASHFARTLEAVRGVLPHATLEVLVPDFKGDANSLRTVLSARPDVLNHNVETVPALYARVRPGAGYERSLELLRAAKGLAPGAASTKSGLMLGLGERMEEVRSVLLDLRAVGCDMLTIGQYMRPGRRLLPVAEYVRPEVFKALGEEARAMGFRFVASEPLARSSMNAGEMFATQKGAR